MAVTHVNLDASSPGKVITLEVGEMLPEVAHTTW